MAIKIPPKKYAYTLTTSNSRTTNSDHYANATITISEVQTYENRPYLTKILEMAFYTYKITEREVAKSLISAIQPACYYESKERWPYRHWISEKITVTEQWGWFSGKLDAANKLVTKLIKERSAVETDWNTTYDRLDTVIKCLDRAGILQAQEDHKTGVTSIMPKGVFSRTDLDGIDLPDDDECFEPAYPWLDQTTDIETV
jgi:hypothetical protein